MLWDKRKKILKKAKPAIKEDLLGMSDIILEAERVYGIAKGRQHHALR